MLPTIPVEDLRVGMYIHLEGGWLSHPFPLSSFRIAADEQIATIRGLGLARVAWVPERSDPEVRPDAPGKLSGHGGLAAAGGAGAAPAGTTLDCCTDSPPDSSLPSPSGSVADAAAAAAAADPAEAAGAAASATVSRDAPASAAQALAEGIDAAGAAGARTARAESPAAPGAGAAAGHSQAAEVAQQAETLQRCEHRHAEAARAWRYALDAVPSHPLRSRQAAESLTQAMLDEMAEAGDIGIRLLAAHQGDRAAAHALNVTVISLLIGRSFGLEEAQMRDMGLGALLHDVGKIDLPDRLRHADPHHGPSEAAAYREHVARGVVHGRRMGLSEGALKVVAQHHEHADGTGFPAGLQGNAMTLPARIVAIVNRYDNLCNPSLAQRALTPHEAVSTLFAQGRGSYDRTVLAAFIRMMGVYPAGSLVQLTDDRYAMVMSVNSSRPLKPRVLVHDEQVPREQALVLNLEQQTGLGIRRSLPPARVPPVALHYLDPRPRVSYYFEPLGAAAAQDAPASARAGASAMQPASSVA